MISRALGTVWLVLTAAVGVGQVSAGDIPIHIEARIPFVTVRVNGQGPFTFILDTGASETLITPSLARELAIETRGPTATQKKGVMSSLVVGDAEVENLKVYVLDPPQALALRLNRGIDYRGILGGTFLCRFVTVVDLKGQRLKLLPLPATRPKKPGRAGQSAGDRAFFFDLRNGLIHVSGNANGKGPVTWIVDTGSAEVLVLPRTAHTLGIGATGLTDIPGVGFTMLDSVSVGPVTASNTPAIIHVPPQDWYAVKTYDGILGYPFLTNFTFSVNYRDRILSFE